jgi:hypothetical protein
MKLFSAIVAAPASDETPPSEEAPAPLPQTGSFDDVLVGAKLGTIASSFAKHAIALDPSPRTDDESSRERDIANCRRYAQSIGVYGATPFLASLYGTGELAQAYCRLGACLLAASLSCSVATCRWCPPTTKRRCAPCVAKRA